MTFNLLTMALLSAFGLELLVGCSASTSETTKVSLPPNRATSHPRAHRTLSASALGKEREDWTVSTSLILTAGDSVNGQIASLLSNRAGAQRGYFIIQDPPESQEAQNGLPRGWIETRTRLGKVADAVKAALSDLKSWDGGADLDDDLQETLRNDRGSIVTTMCSALASARTYYTADGGYANDIAFVLISEKGDSPCIDVHMTRPYATKTLRRALATIAESNNEDPSATVESAFVADHTGFVIPSGQTVTVIGHRVSDAEEMVLCEIHGAGGTGWIPCSWLARKPSRKDG